MKGAVHLVALTLVWLAAACAWRLDVAIDERDVVSRCRTWDWRPVVASTVEAEPSEGPGLHLRLSGLIEQALRARGFVRSGDHADFFVTYHLALTRRTEIVFEPFAPYLLSSLHFSPSYLIEGSRREERAYREVRLTVDVTKTGARTIWRAALLRRVEDRAAVPLEDVVATLFKRFPRRSPGAE